MRGVRSEAENLLPNRARGRRPASGIALAAGLVSAAFGSMAYAGCGATFCAINTDWDVQGQWTEPGVRFDLRYEYIDQDQPRAGTREVSVGELSRHHDEQVTLNRNLLAAVDMTFNDRWGLALSVPFVDREHAHTHHHHGAQIEERWDYRELGDISMLARYQIGRSGSSGYGVRFGVKLPTGDTGVTNTLGVPAERSLQPGTGTADGIVGLFYQSRWAQLDWFLQGSYQAALSKDDGYAPGDELAVDFGMSYPFGRKLSGLIQVNASSKDRDTEEGRRNTNRTAGVNRFS